MSRFANPELDDSQRESVFHSLRRSTSRWDPKPEAPSVEQWREWLTDTSEGVRGREDVPEHIRRRVLARLDSARLDDPPPAADFAAMQALDSRCRRVKYAQWDQVSQIAAWARTSPQEVSDAVEGYRREWKSTPERDRPVVPETYARGWRITSPSMPKDDATIYAFWMAETQHEYSERRRFPQYVAVDVETTGISAKTSDIIEIGCVAYDEDGVERDRWSTLIRPRVNEEGVLDTGPVDVHGITPEDVADAPGIEESLAEFERRTQGACLIGHNLAFDLRHLRYAMDQDRQARGLPAGNYPWIAGVDTFWRTARTVDGLPNRKLATVAEHYGVEYTDGHRAEHDAKVAGDVFFRMTE